MFKLILVYIFAISIAVQPVAMAVDFHAQDLDTEHQKAHQSLLTNTNIVKQSISTIEIPAQTVGHWFNNKSINLLTDHTNDNNNAEQHGECHQGHCHHSSIVFIVKLDNHKQDKLLTSHLLAASLVFNSLSISPDLRPPIT